MNEKNGEICLNGREICSAIKQRVRKINQRKKVIPRLTLRLLCDKAKLSISTYNSWRGGRNPSFPSLQHLYDVLKEYEEK